MWHAGDGANGPGNNQSIGIEICVNDKAGFRQACANAAWLTAELLKRHNLPIEKVVQHYKWTGKNCPAMIRSGEWGITWADYIRMVRENMAPPAPPANPGKLYRVQVGVFAIRANAEAVLARLKKAGFSEAIVREEKARD